MSIPTAKKHITQYKQVDNYTGITDASPHQLVCMLLDGALGKLAMAKGFMAHGEVAKKGEVIGQAISIVGGLRASLNKDAGGELAVNLDDLYDYIERRLIEANMNNDVALINESIRLLREIKTAWDAIPVQERTVPTAVAAAT